MVAWFTFALGMAVFAIVQWTSLFYLPMSFMFYEDGMAKRRRIRLGELVRHMAHGRVELHGPLLYLDTGRHQGSVGAHWSVLAIAILLIGPWVVQSKLG